MRLKVLLAIVSLCGSGFAQNAVEMSDSRRAPLTSGWWKGKPVRFQVVDGMGVVEGDMILGPVEELLTPPSLPTDGTRLNSVLSAPETRWPNKIVIYQIDAAVPNQSRIADAIAHWEAKTSIRFKLRANEAGFALIRRAASGCNSSVGYLGTQQVMNLADSCTKEQIIHELGHTVGFHHSQARNDRDRNIRVNYDNLDVFQWSQYNQNLTTTFDAGPYDYASVMHYSTFNTFSKNYRNGMESIPLGIPFGGAPQLSVGDIQNVERVYGATISDFVVTTHPAGLQVIVDGERFTSPRTFPWHAGEQHTIESIDRQDGANANNQLRFAKWSDGGDAAHTITVDSNTTLYVANYANYYRFRAGWTPSDAGTVQLSPESPDLFYPDGTVLRLTASAANVGFRFFSWGPGPGGASVLAANAQGNAANPVELTLREDGLFYLATFVAPTVPVTTITSKPERAFVTVDGTGAYTPLNRNFAPGTTHTISMAQSQFWGPGSTSQRLQFIDWSNGGARSQTLTAGSSDSTVSANLNQQFEVDWGLTGLRPSSAPTLSIANNIHVSPVSPDGYYDAGSAVQFEAVGSTQVPFANWSGDLSSSTASQTLAISDQTNVIANFLAEPFFNETGLVNGASLQPSPAVPGANMVLYRANIGAEKSVFTEPDKNGNYPTSLNGVTVTFGGTPAQISALYKNAVGIIPPADLAGKTSASVIARAGTATFTRVLPVLDAMPAIYTTDPVNGFGQALAVNADGSDNSADVPVDRGTIMVFLVTGLGKINDDGWPASAVSVEVGGIPAYVSEVVPGQAPGDYGIVIELDPGTPVGPKVPLAMYVAGARSQLKVTVAVR